MIKTIYVQNFVDLKSNLALKSNKGHILLKSVLPQIMTNNSCFPTKRRILTSSRYYVYLIKKWCNQDKSLCYRTLCSRTQFCGRSSFTDPTIAYINYVNVDRRHHCPFAWSMSTRLLFSSWSMLVDVSTSVNVCGESPE